MKKIYKQMIQKAKNPYRVLLMPFQRQLMFIIDCFNEYLKLHNQGLVIKQAGEHQNLLETQPQLPGSNSLHVQEV